MKKKRILVTGPNGFLGRHVTMLLREYDCVFLLSPKSKVDGALEGRCYHSVDDLIAANAEVDVVIHLAAFIPYGNMNDSSVQLQEVNVELTQELTKAYAGARWVFVSSVSVYGNSNEAVTTSTTTAIPNNPYGQSKLQAEQIVSQLQNAAIIRFSSIIGKGMKPVSMIPKWIEQARAEGRIQIWGKGSRTQNYIDLRDAAALVHLLAFSNWKGTVLGTSLKEYSNAQVAATIASLITVEIEHTAHADERGASYEDSVAHKEIGFIPKFDLRDSIIDIIEG